MKPLFPLLVAILLACCSCDVPEQKQSGDKPSEASAETQQNASPGQAVNSEQPIDVEQEKKQVKLCYENFISAIRAQDGKKVVQCVDQKTKNYYAQILEWALTAKRDEVENMPLIDRVGVLTMRFKIPAEQLRGMNGEDILAYAVDNGMVGGHARSGTFTVDGNSGKMDVITLPGESGMFFGFNKENGEWKIDWTSVFPASKLELEIAIRTRKLTQVPQLTENEFIFESLKRMSPDQPPTDDLWNPVGK